MKSRVGNIRVFALLAAFSLGAVCFSAHAELVTELKTEQLYKSNNKVTGPNLSITTLELEKAGILTVQLKELGHDLLETLSFKLLDAAQNVLENKEGSGTWSFLISSPTTLFANIFADPEDDAKYGHYKVSITYQSLQSLPCAPSPVPLPAAAWLLSSGLLGLGALGRKQKLSQISA